MRYTYFFFKKKRPVTDIGHGPAHFVRKFCRVRAPADKTWSPARKPSEAVCVGRGGARERAEFSPPCWRKRSRVDFAPTQAPSWIHRSLYRVRSSWGITR